LKTNQGAQIESLCRAAPVLIVPGGCEGILIDPRIREALILKARAEKDEGQYSSVGMGIECIR